MKNPFIILQNLWYGLMGRLLMPSDSKKLEEYFDEKFPKKVIPDKTIKRNMEKNSLEKKVYLDKRGKK